MMDANELGKFGAVSHAENASSEQVGTDNCSSGTSEEGMPQVSKPEDSGAMLTAGSIVAATQLTGAGADTKPNAYVFAICSPILKPWNTPPMAQKRTAEFSRWQPRSSLGCGGAVTRGLGARRSV
jgi:hypothetical protein